MSHIPDAQHALHLSTVELGFTLLCSSVGALVAMRFSGTMIGRFGSRRVSVTAAILVLAIIPLLLLAPSRILLALVLLTLGAANGTLDVAMNAHATVVQSLGARPILSSIHGWFCIGGFAGGAGTALAKAVGVSPAAHLVFASALSAGLLVALIPGLLPNDADQGDEGVHFIIPKGRLLGLGMLTLLAFFAEGALWDWSAVFFQEELRTSGAVAALGFGVGAGAMAVGRLVGDALVLRLGPVRILQLAGSLTCGGILFAVAFSHPVAAFAGFALAGFGLANAVPVLFTAATRMPGISSGAGLAAVTSIGYAAFLGGPPLVGNIAHVTSMRVGFAVVGVFACFIGIFAHKALEDETITTCA